MQKIGLTGLIVALCMTGCKDNALPPQQLTNIPVVRNTEEANKTTTQNNSENTSASNKTTSYTSSVTPTLDKPSQKCNGISLLPVTGAMKDGAREISERAESRRVSGRSY